MTTFSKGVFSRSITLMKIHPRMMDDLPVPLDVGPPAPTATLSAEHRLTPKECFDRLSPSHRFQRTPQIKERLTERTKERPIVLHQPSAFSLFVYGRYFPERPASMWMAQNPRRTAGSEPTMEDYWEVHTFCMNAF